MANEIFFLTQVLLVIGFTLGAARMGLAALTALVALDAVLANLFVLKQVNLFGFTVTCSDVFAVGSIVGLNLLQEHFGKESAKKAVAVSFMAMLLFMAVSQVHLWYQPAAEDAAHEAYVQILSSAPRIVLASIGVYFAVQRLDVSLFGWLQTRFNGRFLGLRMAISLVLTQAADTVLFTFAGLWGIAISLLDVILVSFAVKCLVIACGAPLAGLSRLFIQKEAPHDVPV